jgi:CheY-like chemotaxis protein
MPEMDGFEATRKIKSLNKHIPVIAQTAFALQEDREKCLQAGCDEHVTKPIDIKDLMLKINNSFNH